MTDAVEALRSYVHFLHEHEGVHQIRLTRTAREGLANIAVKAKSSEAAAVVPGGGSPIAEPTSAGSRRAPGRR
jgi:hypothetical protein